MSVCCLSLPLRTQCKLRACAGGDVKEWKGGKRTAILAFSFMAHVDYMLLSLHSMSSYRVQCNDDKELMLLVYQSGLDILSGVVDEEIKVDIVG